MQISMYIKVSNRTFYLDIVSPTYKKLSHSTSNIPNKPKMNCNICPA